MALHAVPAAVPKPPRYSGRSKRKTLSHHGSFVFLVVTLLLFMATASAPSPIYPLYSERWNFSVSMLTVVFAVYVVGLLAALLTVGSLSDHLGRRPVLIAASLLAGVSTLIFSTADGVTALIVARLVQGVATGAATAALAAALVDFAPHHAPHLGGTLTGVATGLGMAMGAATSGLLEEWTMLPDRYVFPTLTVVFMVIAAGLLAVPDVAELRAGAVRSLRPDVRVPAEARREFLHSVPSTVAGWASTGLFLAIVPSLLGTVMNIDFAAAGGVSIAALFISVALGGLWAARYLPLRAVIRGSLLLATGTAGLVIALALSSAAVFAAGAVLAGFGVGMTFNGNLRAIGAVTTSQSRSQVFSATYVVSYGALSVSSLAAGLASLHLGLLTTGVVYAGTVAIAALIAVIHAAVRHAHDQRSA